MERELRAKIARALTGHEVRLAYLFGSHATGEATELSDIDLAVSFDAGVDARQALGELLDALVRELSTERIDLVLLEETSPPLAYRIVRDGERLLVEDAREDVAFRTRAIMRYLITRVYEILTTRVEDFSRYLVAIEKTTASR